MRPWKVILAILVIFAAGLVTGALVVKSTQPKPPARRDAPYQPRLVQRTFLERMKKELALSPEQAAHLESVLGESRDRIQILWDILGPEIQAEYRDVQERIRAELTPAQREKFEKLLKASHAGRPGGPPPGDTHRPRGRREGSGSNRPPASAAQPPTAR